jgi:hypothetical protein
MLVILLDIEKLVRAQEENTEFPRVVTLSGIVTLVN